MHSEELTEVGVTEEVMDEAMRALLDDLAPRAAKRGCTVGELLAAVHPEIQSAYFFGYTTAVLAKKKDAELTRHAMTASLYAMGQSPVPAVREHAADLRLKLSLVAYQQITEAFRAAGSDPSFDPVRCSECGEPEIRDDVETEPGDPAWRAPEARWRCNGCGRPLDIRDLDLDSTQDWAIRDHVLGVIIKKEQDSDGE
ncbi:hypothetical protein ABZT26_35170 [Streptomyces sp. NPDC005395]|uniref:hypothetical protein n=1 Tax=Streptomyces sp. NPDC005395 TaxID=3157042 RepID=UPI0033ACD03D